MNYTTVTNPTWANPEHTAINCVVNFEGIGEVPFSASQSDPETHGKAIFAACAALTYGPVADYVPLVDAQQPIVMRPISPRQIRMALTQAGLRAQVEAAVAAGDQNLKDWWGYSTTFERNNAQVEAMAAALGVTSAQVDDIWRLGATL